MKAVGGGIPVDGSEKIEGSGSPGSLVGVSSKRDACFAVTMNGKKGRVMYTCLVNGTSQFGRDRES